MKQPVMIYGFIKKIELVSAPTGTYTYDVKGGLLLINGVSGPGDVVITRFYTTPTDYYEVYLGPSANCYVAPYYYDVVGYAYDFVKIEIIATLTSGYGIYIDYVPNDYLG